MEQEKIKEIKKLIRYLADTYGTSKCIGKPNKELFADILTLINELESENERLKKSNCDDCAGCTQWKCDCANIKAYELEKFAERLKEKLKARHEVNRLLPMPVRDVVLSMIEGLFEDVDKTLKEFINE